MSEDDYCFDCGRGGDPEPTPRELSRESRLEDLVRWLARETRLRPEILGGKEVWAVHACGGWEGGEVEYVDDAPPDVPLLRELTRDVQLRAWT